MGIAGYVRTKSDIEYGEYSFKTTPEEIDCILSRIANKIPEIKKHYEKITIYDEYDPCIIICQKKRIKDCNRIDKKTKRRNI